MSRRPDEIVDRIPRQYRGWLLYLAVIGVLVLIGVILQRAC